MLLPDSASAAPVAVDRPQEAKDDQGLVEHRWIITEDHSGPAVRQLRAVVDLTKLAYDEKDTSPDKSKYGYHQLAYQWPFGVREINLTTPVGALKSKEANSAFNSDTSIGWAFEYLASRDHESFQITLGQLDKALQSFNDKINEALGTDVRYLPIMARGDETGTFIYTTIACHKNRTPLAPFKAWMARPTPKDPKNAFEIPLAEVIVGSACVLNIKIPALIRSVTKEHGEIRRAKLECAQIVITSAPDVVTKPIWSEEHKSFTLVVVKDWTDLFCPRVTIVMDPRKNLKRAACILHLKYDKHCYNCVSHKKGLTVRQGIELLAFQSPDPTECLHHHVRNCHQCAPLNRR
jgi:hypothetical protein